MLETRFDVFKRNWKNFMFSPMVVFNGKSAIQLYNLCEGLAWGAGLNRLIAGAELCNAAALVYKGVESRLRLPRVIKEAFCNSNKIQSGMTKRHGCCLLN